MARILIITVQFSYKFSYSSSSLRICSFKSSSVLFTSNSTFDACDVLDAFDLVIVVRLCLIVTTCSSIVGSSAPDVVDLDALDFCFKLACGNECRLCCVNRLFSASLCEFVPQLLLDRVACIDSSVFMLDLNGWPTLTR